MKPIDIVLTACALTVAMWWLGGEARADTYYNCGTTEPAINSSPNTLWCDDFEDGIMVTDNTGTANPANKGRWVSNQPPPGSFPDPGGHAFGRCGTAAGPALVVGGTPGAVNTNCAGTTGLVTNWEGQTPSEADHKLAQFVTSGQDVYIRVYKKCVRVGGCNWSVNTKSQLIVNRDSPLGGIDFAVVQATVAETPNYPCPTNGGNAGCTLSKYDLHIPTNDRILEQNQGINDGTCAPGHSCWEDGTKVGHWYLIEHHIRLNTPGSANGVYELWMDDCGETGTINGCATGGTLRTRYTDVEYLQSNGQTPSGATQIGAAWFLQYSSGGTQFTQTGEWYWDQVVASRVRVGPMTRQGRCRIMP